MNRRAFLRALGLGAGAVVAAPVLQFIPVPKPKPEGVSIRFIRQYKVSGDVSRMDVLYGFGTLRPELAARRYTYTGAIA